MKIEFTQKIKTSCLIALTLLGAYSAHSSDITGFSEKEKIDATKCIKKVFRTNYEHMNNQPNNLTLVERNSDVSTILMHNFVHAIYFDYSKIEHSAILSGSLLVGDNVLSLRNSVLANVTLAGDMSKVDFTGACLINVSLPTATTWFEYRKIRQQVRHYENIEFNDDIYKNY